MSGVKRNRVVANPDGITINVTGTLSALQARQLASGLLIASMAIEKETGPLGVVWPREEVNASMVKMFEGFELSITPIGGR